MQKKVSRPIVNQLKYNTCVLLKNVDLDMIKKVFSSF